MAVASSSPAGAMNRAFSLGPVKMQVLNCTAASADVGGTITFDRLSTIDYVVVTTLKQTAAPTTSGNVATLAFVDPAATVHFQAVAYGR